MNGISIVVCCYNSAQRIVPTLQHLQQQEFSKALNWEVIIVDNSSTDQTARIATQTWNKNSITDFVIVNEDKPGLMHARMKGLMHARYDIVSFIDDDNWVEPGWIEKVNDLFSQYPNIGVCGGRNEAVFEDTPPEWFDKFKEAFAVGKQADNSGIIDGKKGNLWGAGISLKKSVWEELIKREHTNLTSDRKGSTLSSGGDTEICYAFRLLGYNLYYEDDLLLKHYMPAGRLKFSYLEKLYEGFGKAYARLNCYRVILYPDTFKLFPWWYEWGVASKKVISNYLLSFLAVDKEKKWTARTQKAYWKGYALQMLKDRNKLKLYISDLQSVFKK